MAEPFILIETGTPSAGAASPVVEADELAEFYVHAATVEAFLGQTGYGVDTFAEPYDLDPAANTGVFIEGSRHLVRDKDGQQVVSSTKVFARPNAAALFTPDARFRWGAGQEARVITVAVHDGGSLDLPDHIEVFLT